MKFSWSERNLSTKQHPAMSSGQLCDASAHTWSFVKPGPWVLPSRRPGLTLICGCVPICATFRWLTFAAGWAGTLQVGLAGWSSRLELPPQSLPRASALRTVPVSSLWRKLLPSCLRAGSGDFGEPIEDQSSDDQQSLVGNVAWPQLASHVVHSNLGEGVGRFRWEILLLSTAGTVSLNEVSCGVDRLASNTQGSPGGCWGWRYNR